MSINQCNSMDVVKRSMKESYIKHKVNDKILPVNSENVFDRQKIFYGQTDVTPQRLISEKYKQLAGISESDLELVKFGVRSKTNTKISTMSIYSKLEIPNKVQSNSASFDLDDISSLSGFIESSTFLGVHTQDEVYLPQADITMKLPSEITLILKETETISLFELPSVTAAKETSDGEEIEKENEEYDFLTLGKGRNRKTVSNETQFIDRGLMSRFTQTPRIRQRNDQAFASAWDMCDSLEEQQRLQSKIKNSPIVLNRTAAGRNTPFANENTDQCNRFLQCPRLFDSINIMERVLANNTFKIEQEMYKGLSEPIISSTDVKKKCQLNILWTYQIDELRNKPVIVICFNTQSPDIIAVGHGKFKYSGNEKGAVCVWTIKNPMQPERIYHFRSGATSLAFSERNPNLLAVGFHNGDIVVLDIASRHLDIVARSNSRTLNSYEPIWSLKWYYADGFDVNAEHILSIGQDGRINRFLHTKAGEFLCTQIMRITLCDLDINNENLNEQCNAGDVRVLRNPPCLVFCRHPMDEDIYFVGTAVGLIYKCSNNYLSQHISILVAHDGPVYSMEFSHFCPRIFVTSGADWSVKVWMEDVSEALIVLWTMNAVIGAAFCPSYSTIIAAISGTDVFFWDLNQKIDMLASKTTLSSSYSKLTALKFTQDGKNVIVADTKGGVHVYSLFFGVPNPTSDQEEFLINSLAKALIPNPDILKKFNKMGSLFNIF